MGALRSTRVFGVALSLALSLAVGFNAHAESLPGEVGATAVNQRSQLVSVAAQQVQAVKLAAYAYYMDNNAWPPTLATLVSSGHYPGSFETPFGTITGSLSGANYSLSVAVPAGSGQEAVQRMLSAKLVGTVSGGSVRIPVVRPAATEIAKNMLSRTVDPSNAMANTMEANLNMGGFAVLGAGNIDTRVINASETVSAKDLVLTGSASVAQNLVVQQRVTATEALITGSATVQGVLDAQGGINGSTATLTGNVAAASGSFSGVVAADGGITVGGKRIASADGVVVYEDNIPLASKYAQLATGNVFTGLIELNGGAFAGGRPVISSDGGILYESGVPLASKYLVATAKAADSDKLDGVDSVKFARIDRENTFIQNNTFTNYTSFTGGAFFGTGPSFFSSRANFVGGINAGGKEVVSADGNKLSEGGVPLASKYLGLTAKAADAEKVDGIDGVQIARRDVANTFTAANYFNGGVWAGGKPVISRDGNTLYEGGISLSSKYLGINAKAYDADRLDGLDSSQFARRDIDPNFMSNVTVGGRIYANNGVHVVNDWVRVNGGNGIYFESYGGGWHMTDSAWLRAYGNKNVYTAGQIRGDRGLAVTGGQLVAAWDGTLYYRGQDLDGRYLGLGATAANSNLLGGYDSAAFGRLNAANSWNGVNSFGNNVTIGGTVTTNGFLDVNAGIDVTGTATLRNGATLLAGLSGTVATFSGGVTAASLASNADVTAKTSGGEVISMRNLATRLSGLEGNSDGNIYNNATGAISVPVSASSGQFYAYTVKSAGRVFSGIIHPGTSHTHQSVPCGAGTVYLTVNQSSTSINANAMCMGVNSARLLQITKI